MRRDPGYRANLEALPEVERMQLLYGNWNVRRSAGMYFKRIKIGQYLPAVPDDIVSLVRCWDLAATTEDEKGDPAYTAGVLMGKRKNGRFLIIDVINERLSADEAMKMVRHTAEKDRAAFPKLSIMNRVPQDPGQSGKAQAQAYILYMAGFPIKAVLESGSKEARAVPLSAQWEAGNVDVVIADWNEMYLKQMEAFPFAKFKDMVDASANGFVELTQGSQFNIRNLT